MDIFGYPVILADTAGINNDTLDQIEIEGVKRSKERYCCIIYFCFANMSRIEASSIVILMLDGNEVKTKKDLEQKLEEILGTKDNYHGKQILVALNKLDLFSNKIDLNVPELYVIFLMRFNVTRNVNPVYLSCATEEGLSDLIGSIQSRIKNLMQSDNNNDSESIITRSRHRGYLQQVSSSLGLFIRMLSEDLSFLISRVVL
jgi:tRNA modification GTPase